jgi:biopolymer transport protein TolR
MRRKARLASAIRSDINVTPLVDVCLVLLIIFMVVTPLLGKAPDALPERSGQLTVSIQADGKLFVGSRQVAAADLAAALRDLHTTSPEREVVVKGDRRLRYERVRQVLHEVNAAGFARAGLATEKRKG